MADSTPSGETVNPTILVHVEQMEDGQFFATSHQIFGCWGAGDSELDALNEYCDVFVEWYTMGVEDGDEDLPPMALTHSGLPAAPGSSAATPTDNRRA